MINWSYFMITLMSYLLMGFSNISYQITHQVQLNTNQTAYGYSCDKGSEYQYTFLITNVAETAYLHYFVQLNQTSISQNIYKFSGRSTNFTNQGGIFQARTTGGNSLAGNGTFLVFSSQVVTHYTNHFGTNSVINRILTANSSSIIVQSFFKTNSFQIVYVIEKVSNSNYTMSVYNISTKLKQITMPILSNSGIYIKTLKSNSRIYLLFNTGIFIYSQDSSLTYFNSIAFGSTATIYSMDANPSYLIYAMDSVAHILNITNISNLIQLYTIDRITKIDDIGILYPFLYILTNDSLIQYDMDLRLPIVSYNMLNQNISSAGYRFNIYMGKIISTYQDNPRKYEFIPVYMVNQSYASNGSCYEGYAFSASFCTKNMSYIYPVTLNTTVNNSTTNHTSNTTTNATNNTPTIILPDGNPPLNPQQQSSDFPSKFAQYFGKGLTFTNLRVFPKFAQCFSLFLDDLWYYKYHRVDYPDSVQFFMHNVDIINYFRLNPWFLEMYHIFDVIHIEEQTQIVYQKLFTYHKNNPTSIYFINSSKQIYIDNFAMNILLFLVLKVFQILLKLLKNYARFCLKLYNYIKTNSRWWIILTMTIQCNIMRLTFNCLLQHLVFSEQKIYEKFSIFVSSMTLMVLISYCIAFYPLVHKFQSKKSAEALLNHSQYSSSSFFFETFCFLLRSFFRGFLHACFMEFYNFQIISLVVSDLVFVLFLLHYKSQFCNFPTFFTILIYNILFLCLDLIFFLHSKIPQIFDNIDYDYFMFVFIWVLIAVYICSIMCIFIFGVISNINKKPSALQKSRTEFKDNCLTIQQQKNGQIKQSYQRNYIYDLNIQTLRIRMKKSKEEHNPNINFEENNLITKRVYNKSPIKNKVGKNKKQSLVKNNIQNSRNKSKQLSQQQYSTLQNDPIFIKATKLNSTSR